MKSLLSCAFLFLNGLTLLVSGQPVFDAGSAALTNPHTALPPGGKLTFRGFGDLADLRFYLEALGTEAVGGVDCLKLSTKVSVAPAELLWLAQDVEGNVWQLQQQDGLTGEKFDELVLYMPAAPVPGQSFDLWDITYDSNYSVVSTAETVSVSTGLGPYQNCLHLRLSDDGETEDWFFAPGLGLVKVQFAGFDEGGWELESIDGFVPVLPSAPGISEQPQSQTISAGQAAAFSIVATGTGPFSYQWRKDGEDVPGATSAEFTIPFARPADAGHYSVLVGNTAGSTLSAEAELTVMTLAISGRIREGHLRGPAVPDVTVTLRYGRTTQTAVTDSTGAYAFSGLSTGDYSITPAHADFTFDPESVTVNLQADLVVPAFTATRLPSVPPVLDVQLSGLAVLLSWPASVTGFGLERKNSLAPGEAWTPVANTPATTENQHTVSLSLESSAGFFRLRQP